MILEPKITYPWGHWPKTHFLEKSPGVHFCKIQRNHQLKKKVVKSFLNSIMKKNSLSKPPQHVRKVSTFSQKLILDSQICITFCVFFCLKTHLHIRKMTKPQKFPFYEKHHFFHFQKNCTIEKSDINALKSSSNQKIATNACINSANFAF